MFLVGWFPIVLMGLLGFALGILPFGMMLAFPGDHPGREQLLVFGSAGFGGILGVSAAGGLLWWVSRGYRERMENAVHDPKQRRAAATETVRWLIAGTISTAIGVACFVYARVYGF